ncbi:hypothetical protein ALO70_102796 [Pseudomonas amygdali pv. eriobotryae]|uniref:Uncharacterized protein n=1 Tax=Pseudomonas amygdali pv. eriobotryae TaxID=129137 RepID=A0A0P9VFB3_PSEA0|nr:hypothetical protein ALO70_102796 [Pseudomonas amygdali pv. eriobotryae]RML95273.1 hypothetical protein ALQ86_102974 [Pseudomonas amygdali pv. eriobotryae]RMO63772.1 hypothetical protein ALQ39_103238 [Pseudomonas amygdali pv. eriobotryae]
MTDKLKNCASKHANFSYSEPFDQALFRIPKPLSAGASDVLMRTSSIHLWARVGRQGRISRRQNKSVKTKSKHLNTNFILKCL